MFAVSTRNADNIEIYKASGEKIFTITGSEAFKPQYKVTKVFKQDILQLSPDSRYGYLYIQSTDKYIYALYSGESLRSNERANYGKQIHVFDWSGEPVLKYDLDQEIYKFTIDEAKSKIYAIKHNPTPEIVGFNL